MIVTSLEEAIIEVRKLHPSARAEGSTFDWTFLVGDDIVAEMKTNRRSRKHEWKLVFFDPPKPDFK